MHKCLEYEDISTYHYEATIAAEHVKAKRFEDTDWDKILALYHTLHTMHPNDSYVLNMAIVNLQLNKLDASKKMLDSVNAASLEQRSYLLHGCYADYYSKKGQIDKAIASINFAIHITPNQLEKHYFEKKKKRFLTKN